LPERLVEILEIHRGMQDGKVLTNGK